MKVSTSRIAQETSSHRTQTGYISKSRSSLTDWTAKSQEPSEEKTSQYASLTNPTLWDKPSHSTPQSGHATEQTAQSQAPICAYTEIQFTNPRARLAESSTLETQHDTRFLHNCVKEHLTNDNSSVKKHLITCHHNAQNIEAKIITCENDPINLRPYGAF